MVGVKAYTDGLIVEVGCLGLRLASRGRCSILYSSNEPEEL